MTGKYCIVAIVNILGRGRETLWHEYTSQGANPEEAVALFIQRQRRLGNLVERDQYLVLSGTAAIKLDGNA